MPDYPECLSFTIKPCVPFLSLFWKNKLKVTSFREREEKRLPLSSLLLLCDASRYNKGKYSFSNNSPEDSLGFLKIQLVVPCKEGNILSKWNPCNCWRPDKTETI